MTTGSWITLSIIIALVITIVIGYQHEEIDDLRFQNAGFKSSIASLQAKTVAVEKTTIQATQKADTAITKANANSQEIMKHELSNDCAAQIKYLREQAKVINK